MRCHEGMTALFESHGAQMGRFQRGGMTSLAGRSELLRFEKERFGKEDMQSRARSKYLEPEGGRFVPPLKPASQLANALYPLAVALMLANRVLVMSEGQIVDEIAVEFPFPRDWSQIGLAEWEVLRTRVISSLRPSE